MPLLFGLTEAKGKAVGDLNLSVDCREMKTRYLGTASKQIKSLEWFDRFFALMALFILFGCDCAAIFHLSFTNSSVIIHGFSPHDQTAMAQNDRKNLKNPGLVKGNMFPPKLWCFVGPFFGAK